MTVIETATIKEVRRSVEDSSLKGAENVENLAGGGEALIMA